MHNILTHTRVCIECVRVCVRVCACPHVYQLCACVCLLTCTYASHLSPYTALTVVFIKAPQPHTELDTYLTNKTHAYTHIRNKYTKYVDIYVTTILKFLVRHRH